LSDFSVPGPATGFTRQEAVLLLRYVPAKLLLYRLRPLYLAKYVLVALAAVVLAVGGPAWVVVLLVLLFVMAAVAQWFVTRVIRRLGAISELSALDDEIEEVINVWWPNLRREANRLGLSVRPWGLLELGASLATRRRSIDNTMQSFDVRAVIPRDHWDRARLALAQAAGTQPSS
jgi:hypothetical protein